MGERSWDRGWKFPVQVDKSTGKIMMSCGEEDIHEAVLLIVMTAKKERKMRPGFGSNAHRYAFSLGDLSTMALIQEEIKSAIENWEPRVTDVAVSAYVDKLQQEKVMVDISYRVKPSGREHKETIELEL